VVLSGRVSTRALGAAVLAVLALGGCTGAPAPMPPTVAAYTAPDGTAYEHATVVPAADVAAARAAGVTMYVSPATGDGVVWLLGEPVPEPVVAEVRAVLGGPPPASGPEDAARAASVQATLAALDDVGIPVATVRRVGEYATSGSVSRPSADGRTSEEVALGLVATYFEPAVWGLPDSAEQNAAFGLVDDHDAAVTRVAYLVDANDGMQLLDVSV
jgi:hypothetical protein